MNSSSSESPALSRSGRVRKKSSRLLSLEEESVNDEALQFELHGHGDRKKKPKERQLPAALCGPPEKPYSKPGIPKLKLKLKFGSNPSVKKVKVTKAKEASSKIGKGKKQLLNAPPIQPQEMVKPNDEASTSISDDSEISQQSGANIEDYSEFGMNDEEVDVGSEIEEAPPPGDIEIDAPDYVASAEDEEFEQRLPEIEDPPQRPDGKRQTKKPQKLKDDYVEAFERPRNKAAKFFEARKTESKVQKDINNSSKSEKTKKSRLPSAYTMWCNSYRHKLRAQDPSLDFSGINKKLGEIWWSVPIKEKNIWKRKAKRIATHGMPKAGNAVNFLGANSIASIKKKFPDSVPELKPQKCAVKIKPCSTAMLKPMHLSAELSKGRTAPEQTFKITQTEPMDMAAYLTLMGESLTSIGRGLIARGITPVQGSTDMMLDSLLCGMSTLMCLTQQVPELDGDTDPDMHKKTIANIAYYVPDI